MGKRDVTIYTCDGCNAQSTVPKGETVLGFTRVALHTDRGGMSDDELLETYRAAVNKAMSEAHARDGFASNMSRESIVAGLRAVRADLKRIVKARNARQEKASAKRLLANAERSLRLGNDV